MRSWSIPAMLLALGLNLHAADSHSTNAVTTADLKKFQLAPGLKLELFAAEPLLENPVAFSVDSRGRFYIAESHRWATSVFDITQNTPWLLDDLSLRTVNDRAAFLARQFATNFSVLTDASERIRLVEDRDGNGRAETSSIFAEGFSESTSGTAAGVLAQGTNVWFTSVPDLWRFSNYESRMTNGSAGGAFRTNEPFVNRKSEFANRLATGLGVHISVSGHDVHGLIRGHDGRIYFSFGDRGVCVTNREGVVLNVPDTGGVLRCEPDGRNLEIFCIGLRNPQELAFDDYGNLWTVDNDTAGADPCRVLHLVEGGDYGWRMSYQHMKGFGPWVSEELWRGGLDGILPPAGNVSQGPAGLAFHPGTSLTPQLNGKFVHADFPGGIWAYSVKPRGASYELADKEKILWNCWPTDVDFGPDGALYVLDWVESWTRSGKGRIYRLTANDQNPMTKAQLETVRQTQRLLAEGMGKRGEKELLGLLGDSDRRVRLEAQWELAGRGLHVLAGLVEQAKGGANQLMRIHSLWGIRQVVRMLPSSVGAAELASLLPLLKDVDGEIRGQAALTLGEGLLFNAEKPMSPLLADVSPRTVFLAIQGYTARWKSEFGSDGSFPGERVFFSARQRISGAVADKVATTLGTDRSKAAEMVGASISGNFPAQEINRLLPDSKGESFITQAAMDFLVNTRRNNAFESHFRIAPSQESTLALVWAYRQAATAALGDFFTNQEPRILLEATRAINDAPIPAAYPALAALLEDPRFRDANWGWSALSNITPAGPFSANVRPPRDQILLRALNANFRLGDPKNAEALVRFAVGAPVSDPARAGSRRGNEADGSVVSSNPPPHVGRYLRLRAEALFLLGAWEVLPAKIGDLSIKPAKDPNHGSVPTVNPENWPGWFDRVVGLYRPLPPRPPDDARQALAPHIAAFLADSSSEVAGAALDAAVKLRLTNASPTLLVLMRSSSTPAALRKKIPDALAALGTAELGDAVKFALAENDAGIRAAALPHLGQLHPDEAARILGGIVATVIGAPVTYPASSSDALATGRAGGRRSEDDMRLAQAALAALGRLDGAGADEVLLASLKRLVDGKLPTELELDLIEAASRRTAPEIKSLLTQRPASRPKDDVLGDWRSALTGGDAERGRTIFFDKVEVQCARCHMVKGQGGIVGPKLDGIARQRSREYLLESIVFPNRAIATGFENVTLTLKNRTEPAGVVKREDANELQLESPEDGLLRIAKADVVTRQRGLSAMPEGMQQFLTKREVRDLVEYLAGLK